MNFRAKKQVFVVLLAFAALLVRWPVSTATSQVQSNLKISGTLPADSWVHTSWPLDFVVTADGQTAVYTVYSVASATRTLFATSVTNGNPVQLSNLLPSGADIERFFISPDGQTIIYFDDNLDLYRVSIDGSNEAKLTDNGTAEKRFYWLEFSNDSEKVAYLTGENGVSEKALFVLFLGSNNIHQLNPSEGIVGEFNITQDSGSLVFSTEEEVNDHRASFYTVSLEGGNIANSVLNVTKLDLGFLGAGEHVKVYPSFTLSPTSNSFVIRIGRFPTVDDEDQLYAVFLGNNYSTTLLTDASLYQPDYRLHVFGVSHDGSKLFYTADNVLRTVSMSGGNHVRLNAEGERIGGTPIFSPDGSHIVYGAIKEDEFSTTLLYAASTAGGGQTLLKSATGDGYIGQFQISPDGEIVVYSGDPNGDGDVELQAVSINGGSSTSLIPADGAILYGEIQTLQFYPDSSEAVFSVFPVDDFGAGAELYNAPLDGSMPTKLNDPFVDGGGLSSYRVASNGIAVYAASQDTLNRVELFSTVPAPVIPPFPFQTYIPIVINPSP